MAKKKNEATGAEGCYVVYCKLPCGQSFPLPGGRKVVLNGSNHKTEEGHNLTVVGYGRTEVPIEDWEYVMSVYGELKVFSADNPLIFAAENQTDGDDIAREYGPTTRNGMEQRDPKQIIKTAERQANNVQAQE